MPTDQKFWIFQVFLDSLDFEWSITKSPNMAWNVVGPFQRNIRRGHKVYIWECEQGGIIATGTIVSDPSSMAEAGGMAAYYQQVYPRKFKDPHLRVRLRIDRVLLPDRIGRATVKEHPLLSWLPSLEFWDAPNLPITEEQSSAIESLIRSHDSNAHEKPGMTRICPNPVLWNELFQRLTEYARQHPCVPPAPPKPLILSGWGATNDVEKLQRWEKTVAWTVGNGCAELVSAIPDRYFYFVQFPSTHEIGPMGGPMYRPWDFEKKARPESELLARQLDSLRLRWKEVVGAAVGGITRPAAFTGKKARRLLVVADSTAKAPWGGWASLSTVQAERRAFTRFREAINRAIVPHEVDHIDFTVEEESVPREKGG